MKSDRATGSVLMRSSVPIESRAHCFGLIFFSLIRFMSSFPTWSKMIFMIANYKIIFFVIYYINLTSLIHYSFPTISMISMMLSDDMV